MLGRAGESCVCVRMHVCVSVRLLLLIMPEGLNCMRLAGVNTRECMCIAPRAKCCKQFYDRETRIL